MARFLSKVEFHVGDKIELSPEESHHLSKVLRMESGDECFLVNGVGGVARAKVEESHSRKSKCTILEVETVKKRNRIHVAFAIPKSNAIDFIVHRCTEVGVGSFQPLITDHSQKINSWNQERWERVITETAKQCQESHFPRVLAPMDLKTWVTQKRDKQRELVYCDEESRQDSVSHLLIDKDCDLLIGSEGGWSASERILFQNEGKGMGLGKNRLRAETACIVGLSLLKKHYHEI